jgi:ribosomal protein S6--L-glutamate ligase
MVPTKLSPRHRDLKIAVVGIPGKWSSELLADALAAHTGFKLIIDLGEVSADLTNNRLIYRGQDLTELDALVIKKAATRYHPGMIDRLEMLRIAEAQGVKVFSSAEKIIRLVDRLSCTVALRQADIPMPPTLVTENLDAALEAVHSLGEVILKPLFSTKAKGMVLLSAQTPLKKLREQLFDFQKEQGFFYIQQKIHLPNQDLGLMFLGGQYQGTYARVNQKHAWTTSTETGGKYAPAQPQAETLAMAERAQAVFKLDFTTVDMAETADGPMCFEVSAFGGFKGAYDALGINIAERYADYVIQQLQATK